MDNNQIKEIENKVIEVQKFNSDKIARLDELGSAMAFIDPAKKTLEAIEIFRQIDATLICKLPPKYIDIIGKQADAFFNKAGAFIDFNPQDPNVLQVREGIITNFHRYVNNLHNSLAEPIAYQSSVSRNSSDQLAVEKEIIKAKEKDLDETIARIKSFEDDVVSLSENLKVQASESGVTQEAIHFNTEANEHQDSAKNWQNAIWIFACLIIIFAFVSILFLKPPSAGISETINFVANKLMIFGVLVYMLNVATKSYQSHMHNRTVNRHRKNSLLTYRTLIDGAFNEDTKDKILESASNCIYSHQDSGYIKNCDNSGSSINSIIELMPKSSLKGQITETDK